MKPFLLFTALTAMAKAGIWILLGIILKNHLESFWVFISRKPLPENMVEQKRMDELYKLIGYIGICLIIIGIGSALASLAPIFLTPFSRMFL